MQKIVIPVMFPENFYLRCYEKGIDGILIAVCGSDCPYQGAYPRPARRVEALLPHMRQQVQNDIIGPFSVNLFLREP